VLVLVVLDFVELFVVVVTFVELFDVEVVRVLVLVDVGLDLDVLVLEEWRLLLLLLEGKPAGPLMFDNPEVCNVVGSNG